MRCGLVSREKQLFSGIGYNLLASCIATSCVIRTDWGPCMGESVLAAVPNLICTNLQQRDAGSLSPNSSFPPRSSEMLPLLWKCDPFLGSVLNKLAHKAPMQVDALSPVLAQHRFD
eukprot:686885-Amphidinium_carterae.1